MRGSSGVWRNWSRREGKALPIGASNTHTGFELYKYTSTMNHAVNLDMALWVNPCAIRQQGWHQVGQGHGTPSERTAHPLVGEILMGIINSAIPDGGLLSGQVTGFCFHRGKIIA